MIRLLDCSAVASIFTMEAALQMAKAAFLALDEGRAVMPERLATKVERHGGTHLSMPCYAHDEKGDALSIKIATVFESNTARGLPTTMASLLLHNADTGELVSLMDAEYLTAMRTGAASALATQLLALPEVPVVTIFGAGAQAEAQLQGVAHVRHVQTAYVISRNPNRSKAFADRMSASLGVDVRPANNAREAVKASQVICAATTSKNPVFDGQDLQPGTHVNAVGAFRPDMCELDPEVLRQSLVYVDRLESAKTGAGDLIQAVQAGYLKWDQIAGELGGLVSHRLPGRTDHRLTTVFKSVGLAVQDVFAARWIFHEAEARGLGTQFSLT